MKWGNINIRGVHNYFHIKELTSNEEERCNIMREFLSKWYENTSTMNYTTLCNLVQNKFPQFGNFIKRNLTNKI
jgi:hypothetical protein